jgi:flotillin
MNFIDYIFSKNFRRKQIAVEEKEILRKEKELTAMVKLPAEAEAYKVEQIAQGKRTQTIEASRAEAQRIKMIGAADAYAIEAIGKAEAERMRMKAAAYKQYGDAAILSLTLEALPKVWVFALIITFMFNLNLKSILTQIFKSI